MRNNILAILILSLLSTISIASEHYPSERPIEKYSAEPSTTTWNNELISWKDLIHSDMYDSEVARQWHANHMVLFDADNKTSTSALSFAAGFVPGALGCTQIATASYAASAGATAFTAAVATFVPPALVLSLGVGGAVLGRHHYRKHKQLVFQKFLVNVATYKEGEPRQFSSPSVEEIVERIQERRYKKGKTYFANAVIIKALRMGVFNGLFTPSTQIVKRSWKGTYKISNDSAPTSFRIPSMKKLVRLMSKSDGIYNRAIRTRYVRTIQYKTPDPSLLLSNAGKSALMCTLGFATGILVVIAVAAVVAAADDIGSGSGRGSSSSSSCHSNHQHHHYHGGTFIYVDDSSGGGSSDWNTTQAQVVREVTLSF